MHIQYLPVETVKILRNPTLAGNELTPLAAGLLFPR